MKGLSLARGRFVFGSAWAGAFWIACALAPTVQVAAQQPSGDAGKVDVVELLSSLLEAPSTQAASADPEAPWKLRKKSFGPGGGVWISLDPLGSPHINFKSSTNKHSGPVHAWLDGSKWRSEKLFVDGQSSFPNAMLFDSAGEPHFLFRAEHPGDTFVVNDVRHAHKVEGEWVFEVAEDDAFLGASAMDANDLIHAITPFSSSFHHLIQTEKGWDSEDVAVPSGLETSLSNGLLIRDGTLYATFRGGFSTDVKLATNDGGGWDVQDVEEGGDAAMTVDSEGIVHFVYVGTAGLRHASLEEGVWQYETLADSTTLFGETADPGLTFGFHNPALAAGPDGRLQLAFGIKLFAGEQSGLTVVIATFEDGAWAPSAIGPAGTGYSDVAITETPTGIVHVATSRAPGEAQAIVMDLASRGNRLTVSVVPKNAGTVTLTPTGAETSTKLIKEFSPEMEVSLMEVPAPGFTFVGWLKDATGDADTTSVTMDKKRRVVAKFAPVR